MRLAICDDNITDLQAIRALTLRYDPRSQISTFAAARELLDCKESFDCILLDIEMEAPNGFDVALTLSKRENSPIIIFVTNSAAYAVRGYGLALRYLLKPLSFDALAEALDAAASQLHRNRLTLNVDGVTRVVQAPDIRYAEVSGHRITLHLGSEVVTFRASLKELTAALPGRLFCAPHQSYIVNLLHVSSVSEQSLRLSDGTRIPISRRRLAEITEAFHAFLGVDVW